MSPGFTRRYSAFGRLERHIFATDSFDHAFLFISSFLSDVA